MKLLATTCLIFAVGHLQAEEPVNSLATPPVAATKPQTDWLTAPKPKPVEPPPRAEIEGAIERGVAFLVKDQNQDGSWGTPKLEGGIMISASVPGSHQAFRAATTSLCLCALIELNSGRDDVNRSIERGESWLMQNLPHVRRAEPDLIYNVWTHSYGIQALVRMYGRMPADESRREKIRQLIRQQIGFLERYESVDGGWGYYDFVAGAKKPSSSSISFTSATGLIALYEAKQSGIEVPERIVHRAYAAIKRQRKKDFSYMYGEYLKYSPMGGINRPGGSLGRSQVCNLAMRLWGDKEVTDQVVTVWLDRLFSRNLWLDIGRKRPIPHESWFQVAAYFYYYGHYYASLCIELLPPDARPAHQDQLATLLLKRQEKDGSWWDFPFYNYHRQYGTSFALMALYRCRRADMPPATLPASQ